VRKAKIILKNKTKVGRSSCSASRPGTITRLWFWGGTVVEMNGID
jgi:hypothetical protein